jgi:hypothetical protein
MSGLGISGYNVSEKYKFLWWAPERTGSRGTANVLSYFDFQLDGKIVSDSTTYHYTHQCLYDELYDGYKIIGNVRNPYGRVLSTFQNFGEELNINKGTFKKYLFDKVDQGKDSEIINRPNFVKTPDYVLRLEHLEEDYSKLPFIRNRFTESQIYWLSIHGKPLTNWEEFYDKEMRDFVYKICQEQFDRFGYSK